MSLLVHNKAKTGKEMAETVTDNAAISYLKNTMAKCTVEKNVDYDYNTINKRGSDTIQ